MTDPERKSRSSCPGPRGRGPAAHPVVRRPARRPGPRSGLSSGAGLRWRRRGRRAGRRRRPGRRRPGRPRRPGPRPRPSRCTRSGRGCRRHAQLGHGRKGRPVTEIVAAEHDRGRLCVRPEDLQGQSPCHRPAAAARSPSGRAGPPGRSARPARPAGRAAARARLGIGGLRRVCTASASPLSSVQVPSGAPAAASTPGSSRRAVGHAGRGGRGGQVPRLPALPAVLAQHDEARHLVQAAELDRGVAPGGR